MYGRREGVLRRRPAGSFYVRSKSGLHRCAYSDLYIYYLMAVYINGIKEASVNDFKAVYIYELKAAGSMGYLKKVYINALKRSI